VRESDLAVAADLDDLHLDFVAFLHDVGHALDARVRHLGDVKQAVGAGDDLDERTEVGDALDRALVDGPDLGLRGEPLDDRERLVDGVGVARGDVDRAVVLDVDRDAGLVDDPFDRLAAGEIGRASCRERV
jgi:hypothetical protein